MMVHLALNKQYTPPCLTKSKNLDQCAHRYTHSGDAGRLDQGAAERHWNMMVRHGIHHAYVYGRNLNNQNHSPSSAHRALHKRRGWISGTCCQSRKAVASERTSRRFHSPLTWRTSASKCALRAIGTAFSRLAPEEQHGQSVGLRAAATFVAKWRANPG